MNMKQMNFMSITLYGKSPIWVVFSCMKSKIQKAVNSVTHILFCISVYIAVTHNQNVGHFIACFRNKASENTQFCQWTCLSPFVNETLTWQGDPFPTRRGPGGLYKPATFDCRWYGSSWGHRLLLAYRWTVWRRDVRSGLLRRTR